jgi:hypothetical protein
MLLVVMFFGCSTAPPKQVQPRLSDYVDVNSQEQDIPITNMPGHEPPELCPVECVCPKLFGLTENPCIPKKQPCPLAIIIHDEVEMEEFLSAAMANNRMVMMYYDTLSPDPGALGLRLNLDALRRSEKLLNYFFNFCRSVSWQYSVGIVLDEDLYRYAINHYSENLAWQVGDYIPPPALGFIKDKKFQPISFSMIDIDDMVSGKVCVYAEAFYEATH